MSEAHTAPEEVTLQFKEILKSNGITEPVSKVTLGGSGLKGENFGGLTEYVTVNFENPWKKPLHLFVKKKTDQVEFNKILDEFLAYQKESVFFMEYLPRAREYCKSMGHEELMDIYPKAYFGNDKMIILENLVVGRGFVLLDKEERQDFAAAHFALVTLAKHHAISHAMIKELGGVEPFFERFPILRFEAFLTDVVQGMFRPIFENAIDTNINILEKCDIEGRDEARKKLLSWKGKAMGQVVESLKNTPEGFLVLNHGDYWNNNMMFTKDKKTGTILEHVAVDFQITRYASPCLDLGKYLFTSVKPNVRRGQLRQLLTVYLDALKVVSSELGHPITISLEASITNEKKRFYCSNINRFSHFLIRLMHRYVFFLELEVDFCRHFHYGYWTAMNLTTGPGYEVLKDIDIGETQDMTKMAEMFDRLVLKWIDEHPEECKKKAQNIIEYVKEHELLSNGLVT